MDVTITVDGKKLYVESPYNAEFPTRARALGGKWKDKRWVFPAHVEQQVRELCVAKYGTDGSVAPAMVTVRVTLGEDRWCSDLALAGIPVARTFGRDEGVVLSDGVSLLAGSMSSGGSRKNFRLRWDAGTQVQLEVPETLIERLRKDENVQALEVVSAENDRRAELRAEAEGLRARLEQIEAELAQLGGAP